MAFLVTPSPLFFLSPCYFRKNIVPLATSVPPPPLRPFNFFRESDDFSSLSTVILYTKFPSYTFFSLRHPPQTVEPATETSPYLPSPLNTAISFSPVIRGPLLATVPPLLVGFFFRIKSHLPLFKLSINPPPLEMFSLLFFSSVLNHFFPHGMRLQNDGPEHAW